MVESQISKRLVQDMFQEEALLIGGLITTYDMSDDFIWALCRNLDSIRIKYLRKLRQQKQSQNPTANLRLTPHPAVQELLRKVKEQ